VLLTRRGSSAIPITSGNSIIPRNPRAEKGRKRAGRKKREDSHRRIVVQVTHVACHVCRVKRIDVCFVSRRCRCICIRMSHLPLSRPNDGCTGIVIFFGERLITRQRPSEVSRPLDVSSLPFALTRTGHKFDDCAAE